VGRVVSHDFWENKEVCVPSSCVEGVPIPLILYIAAKEKSLGALCIQDNEEEKEVTPHYLSRKLVGAELKYSPIEKIYLSLIFAI